MSVEKRYDFHSVKKSSKYRGSLEIEKTRDMTKL